MRIAAVLLALSCALAAVPAAAQTCPPNDPLCTKDSQKSGKQKADDAEAKPAESPPARGVITLAEVTITGRVQKPIAAVDVARISPRLTLATLRHPFLERIEQVIYSDPF